MNEMLLSKTGVIRRGIIFACTLLLFSILLPDDGSAGISIIPSEKWSNYFGGRHYILNYGISATKEFQAIVAWRISADKRTLMRGETTTLLQTGNHNQFHLEVSLPPVKPGVTLPVEVQVTLFKAGSRTAIGRSIKKLWLFHENPFVSFKKVLKELNIVLFDPTGDTLPIFRSYDIPFQQAKRPSELMQLRNAVLIVGEGLSLQQFRGFSNMLEETASVGNKVICLALKDGQMPIRQTDVQNIPIYHSMIFRGKEAIGLLDRRLDMASWPPNGDIIRSSIKLEGQRNKILGKVMNTDCGWPWVEFSYKAQKGKLLFCGFAIISKWDDSPTPRFLLNSILNSIGRDER